MLKTYRSLLRIPHARAFVLAGFVARLSISMRALGAVLMVSELTGSPGPVESRGARRRGALGVRVLIAAVRGQTTPAKPSWRLGFLVPASASPRSSPRLPRYSTCL